ncbi:MAG TPA: glucose 1-dehydrogenase [Clostridiaceae bacterium]|jgi:NAD(P)-dependent dehydrogenase (short-subunit alcohol dehydrogenase family)|nr:glucose 1-dehydrogenase [Clostridiaceae bacterium]
MARVNGKIAIVTGGAMGMGNGCATVLARNGAKVALMDRSDTVHAAADTLCKEGYEVIAYQVDVRDAAKLKEYYDDVAKKFGKIDILVNAAGIGPQRTFLNVDDEFLDNYMAINFRGIWNSCKAAVPHMLKNGYGKIVNFASVTGVLVVDPGMTAYAATKGAIMAFTKALAIEFASRNITVNAILPGVVDTPMMRNTCKDTCPEDPDSIFNAIAAQVPMGRMGTAEEAGRVALFLASEDSSYITGIGIVFDGGNTIPETPGSGWEPNE